ncbi:hypothetical protein C2R69_02965 [Helicobacter pylori]|nr:hypothetical protein C2R69_02965 [Helicobacter pylori]
MAIRFGVIFIVDFLRAISVDDKNRQLRSIKNTLSSHRVCFCSEIHSVCSENSLICHLNQGSYIIDLHLIGD